MQQRAGSFSEGTNCSKRRCLIIRQLLILYISLGFYSFAAATGQSMAVKVTIRLIQEPFDSLVKEVERQTEYKFLYGESHLKKIHPISIQATDRDLQSVLTEIFESQPLSFQIKNKYIIVSEKDMRPNAIVGQQAQPIIKPLEGIVQDVNGDPVPGCLVKIKGTNISTVTDNNGLFKFQEAVEAAVIIISGVNIETKEIPSNGKSSLLVIATYAIKNMKETVVLAYGTESKSANTGAVSVVKGKEIETLPNRSFDRSLQGKVPGLLVSPGTGQPGGGLSNFIIRGIGTGTNPADGATIRNPLIVIDGVPITQDYIQPAINGGATPISNPIAQINPIDIESISILKDAAAIALYGSRASNGVIIVTTKKGKAGKPTISVRHQTDIATRMKPQFELLNQSEYLNLLYDTYKNVPGGTWTDQSIKTDLIRKFPTIVSTPGDTTFYPQENWFNSLYSSSAVTLTNDLSISGGSDKSTYFLNIGYLKQDGILMNTGYERTSLRYNVANQITHWLNFGMNTNFSYNVQRFSGNGEYSYEVNGLPYGVSPLLPIRDLNGDYIKLYNGFGMPSPYLPDPTLIIANPLLSMEYNTNRITSYRGLGNVFASIDFLKYFKFKSSLGIDFMLATTKRKVDPRITDILQFSTIGYVSKNDLTRTLIVPTNTLNFNIDVAKKHNIGALVGFEAQKSINEGLGASATGYNSPFYDMIVNGTMRNSNDSYSEETLSSLFAQASYNYNEKYYFTASGRSDGTSKFGIRERFGKYWSLGGAWILTEEEFIRNSLKFVDLMKVRGSIGTSGNAGSIPRNLRFNTLRFINYGGSNAGVQANAPGNPDIKWEQTFNVDLGLELRLFRDRISFTGDIYRRQVSNLLYSMELPGHTGWIALIQNIGEMENKGIELSLASDIIKTTDLSVNLSLTWSANKNKLTKANPSTIISGSLINKVGDPFNSFYLPVWAGVNSENGLPQWYDSTGKIVTTYPTAVGNRQIVGKTQPDGFGGATLTVRYRGFECSAFLYYQYGFQVYDAVSASLLNDGSSSVGYLNQKKEALNYWKKPGDIAPNPRRRLNNTDRGNAASTRYLFDGDFLQLNNIYISYSIPPVWAKYISLKSIKVFAQANNLALWTKYPGINPSNVKNNGGAEFAYPLQKTYTIGATINL